MTRRERLMATINGKPVDRPPVSFYEIHGAQDTSSKDPYNIYSHPSWRPLIELARERTDRIVMTGGRFRDEPPNPVKDLTQVDQRMDNGSKITTTTIRAGKRVLRTVKRRDLDVNTVWTLEHLLKDTDDLQAWLELPEPVFGGTVDSAPVLDAERELGDAGIVMMNISDPLCQVASLFSMEDFTIVALTEPALFHRALERSARYLNRRIEALARDVPGRLWRIVGPEYASPPYLPPHLFKEYATRYDIPLVESIHRYGGFARIHSHGRLHDVLDHIVATGCMGLDPVEPPPQGDVELAYVRERYGRQLVLFGNLEASDIENLDTAAFGLKVDRALREGTKGEGRGFVLQPSACPYGRVLGTRPMKNYELMVKKIEEFGQKG